MNITVCAKRDLPACLALNQLLPGLQGHRLQLLLSNVTRQQETVVPELEWIKLFERDVPNGMVFPALDALTDPTGRLLTFHHLAKQHGAALHAVTGINDGPGLALLRAHQPDLVISVRFSHIFKAAALSVPRLGIVNIHPGELPRYAGLFAPFHAMLEDEPAITCSVHVIDDGIDTGPVLASPTLPVDPSRSLAWHVARVYPLGVRALLALLDTVEARTVVPIAQDHTKRCYRSLPTPDALAAFRARGLRLVDPRDYDEFLTPFASSEHPVPAQTPAAISR